MGIISLAIPTISLSMSHRKQRMTSRLFEYHDTMTYTRRACFKKVDAPVASAHFPKNRYHIRGIFSGWRCIEYREKRECSFGKSPDTFSQLLERLSGIFIKFAKYIDFETSNGFDEVVLVVTSHFGHAAAFHFEFPVRHLHSFRNTNRT